MSSYRCWRACATPVTVVHLSTDVAIIFFYDYFNDFLFIYIYIIWGGRNHPHLAWGWPKPFFFFFFTLALGGGSATPMGHRGGSATPRPASHPYNFFYYYYYFKKNLLKLKTTIFFSNIYPCDFIHFMMRPMWF
jgi:hypothetical protein